MSSPSAGPNTLAVYDANKTGFTSAGKPAAGRFTFNKAHPTLNIQAAGRLKLQKLRLRILTATRVDALNWDLKVALKPKQSLANGAAEGTKGADESDESGPFRHPHSHPSCGGSGTSSR